MKVHFLGAPASTYLTDKMSASSRVCPKERAVWRFDARGGYPWGWSKSGQIWARFGATFLSLERRTEWSKWAHGQAGHDFRDKDNRVDKMSTRLCEWSKRHFVALIQSIHKNGSTPQNEALKCTVFYKASPHNEDLALGVLKVKASVWGLAMSGSCPHFEGMKFGRSCLSMTQWIWIF